MCWLLQAIHALYEYAVMFTSDTHAAVIGVHVAWEPGHSRPKTSDVNDDAICFNNIMSIFNCTGPGIALGLGLPEGYFETLEGGGTSANTSYWAVRCIHYPPLATVLQPNSLASDL